jgi:chromosome segregation ATPase
MNKLSSELTFVTQQQADIDHKSKKLSNEMNTLRLALEKQELELKQNRILESDIKKEVAAAEKLSSKIAQDHTTLQQKHLETLSQQTTLEKGAQNVLKEAQKLREKIAEKEQKLADIQNEIARIKIDSLNTEAHNKELRATCTFFFFPFTF